MLAYNISWSNSSLYYSLILPPAPFKTIEQVSLFYFHTRSTYFDHIHPPSPSPFTLLLVAIPKQSAFSMFYQCDNGKPKHTYQQWLQKQPDYIVTVGNLIEMFIQAGFWMKILSQSPQDFASLISLFPTISKL